MEVQPAAFAKNVRALLMDVLERSEGRLSHYTFLLKAAKVRPQITIHD